HHRALDPLRDLVRLHLLGALGIEEGGRFLLRHLAVLPLSPTGGLLGVLLRILLLLVGLRLPLLRRFPFLSLLLLVVGLRLVRRLLPLPLLLIALLILLILLVLLVLVLLILLILLLLLLLELLLQLGDLLLDELVIELDVDVVGRGSHRAPVCDQRLGVEPERGLGIRSLGGFTEPVLRVPHVVGDARRPRRIGVGARDLLEGVQGVGVLPLLVGGVAQVEVQQGRIGLIGERLVVGRDRIIVLPGRVEARRLAGLRIRIEPADRHRGERDGGERDVAPDHAGSAGRRQGSHRRRAARSGARRSPPSGSSARRTSARASGTWKRCSNRRSSVLSSSRFSMVSM